MSSKAELQRHMFDFVRCRRTIDRLRFAFDIDGVERK